ncbi:hypothetical protein F5887DRAFT_971656 [Amanita rubescens]|nr:hypothetical protein F5887DRAFT_971656 [Amanita rubescens]
MILLNPLYNKPNNITEKQRIYQSDTRNVMWRLPRSKLYVGTFGTIFVVGMFSTVYGVASLIKGKPAQ